MRVLAKAVENENIVQRRANKIIIRLIIPPEI